MSLSDSLQLRITRMNISPGIQTVSSLDMEELQPYRTLRRQEDHKKQGILVAEGGKVVQRLLDSGLPIVSMLATKDRYARLISSNSQPPISPKAHPDDRGAPVAPGDYGRGQTPAGTSP
jgi:hypothetical protein